MLMQLSKKHGGVIGKRNASNNKPTKVIKMLPDVKIPKVNVQQVISAPIISKSNSIFDKIIQPTGLSKSASSVLTIFQKF